jgi:hypothetical protein
MKQYVWKFLKLQSSLDIIVYEQSRKRKKETISEGWRILKIAERERLTFDEIERVYSNKLKIIADLEYRKRVLYQNSDVSLCQHRDQNE